MAVLAALACQAQLSVDDKDRMGTVSPEKAKALYLEVFGPKSPIVGGNEAMPVSISFYLKFRQLIELAPYSNYAFYTGYLYENANEPSTPMYRRMLDSIADPALKVMFVEDVVEHADMYVDHLDSLNMLRTMLKLPPLTQPLAKIKRAHYNYNFAHDTKYYPSHLYDKKKAYELYREAFKEFMDAKDEQGGDELPGFYVSEYFKTCIDLYKTDEEKYYEQFLGDYQELVQLCDKLLVPYYEIPDSVKNDPNNPKYSLFQDYNFITNAQEEANGQDGVKALFKKSGAAETYRLKAYYAPRLETNRRDVDYLNKAISFMYANGFVNDTLFYEYCKASHDLAPTYENCIGLASSAYLGLVDKAEMRDYYTEALGLASSEANKAKIRFWIATSLYTTRPRDAEGNTYGKSTPEYQQWENDIFACNTNLSKMLESSDELLKDPSLDVRGYVAQAHYMMGENYYWLAALNTSMEDVKLSIQNFNTASEMNLPSKPINGRAVNVASRLEAAEKVRKSIQERMADARRRKAATDAYNAYIKKKQAEEAFWNQGK